MTSELIPQSKILVAGQDEIAVTILKRAGCEKIFVTGNSGDAISTFSDKEPDLIMVDLRLPPKGANDFLVSMQGRTAAHTFLPVIALTASDETPDTKQQAIVAGVTDFVQKPFDEMDVVLRVRNGLRMRLLYRQLRNHSAQLDDRVRERTRLLERTIAELKCSTWPLFCGIP
jgi:putative two-component system response regulator